jgi:putative heme-binding domain-containing protein
VTAAVKEWVAALNPEESEFDRLCCEALWVLQSHHAVDEELLRQVLAAKTPQARAAAMHIVADERDYLPGALELMAAGARDESPRVRLEAVRGMSFVQSLEAVNAALSVLELPTDSWIDYTLDHTLMALEPVWSAAFQSGTLAKDNERGQKYLADFVARQRPSLVAEPHLKIALNPATSDAPRVRAYASLEGLHGNSGNGEAVFRRVCLSCHKVKDAGFVFGPELTDVAKRLTRRDLIESIIEPSKKLEPKYVTTTIVTGEGKPEVGFVLEKTKESVTLLMAEGKQKTFKTDEIEDMAEMKQSSMPENLGATISAGEFLDVIEYLSTLK